MHLFRSSSSKRLFEHQDGLERKLTRGLGKRPNKITPATAQANTKERAGEVTRWAARGRRTRIAHIHHHDHPHVVVG